MEKKECKRISKGFLGLAFLFAWQMALVVSFGVLYCKLTALPCKYLVGVEGYASYCFLFVLLGIFRVIDIVRSVYDLRNG